MIKYTQEDFDAFPVIDGVKQCPSGDYTDIMGKINGKDYDMTQEFDNNETELKLCFSFPDQSESFVLGYEAGIICERMKNESFIDCGFEGGFPAHVKNLELFDRMCQHYGFEMEIRPSIDNTWIPIRFKQLPKVKHLGIVK